ncbi:MAG: hypothetical protein WCT77_02010, partial [Bacteroidota bacterium]
MKDIKNLTYRGNKSFSHIKGLLRESGVTKLLNVRRNLMSVDGVMVTITRFEFLFEDILYFCACEPETDIFEIDTKPIK